MENLANTAQFAKWRQMSPQRNIIKGLFVSDCISAEEGNVMHGVHGWAFNPPKAKLHFLFGREEGSRRGSQEARMLPVGRALYWNEHVGGGMGQKNEFFKCCGQ